MTRQGGVHLSGYALEGAMNKTSEMYHAQRQADLAHHKNRVEWLESENPCWADGEPVLPSDRVKLLLDSREYLKNPASGFNHCHCVPRCA